jgi:hypothetical protein
MPGRRRRQRCTLGVLTVVAALLLVACAGTPGPLPSSTPSAVGDIGPVETESPIAYPGYGPASGGAEPATPYPLACATWLVHPPRADVTVSASGGGPHSATLHVGQTLLITARETCDFSWNVASAEASDPDILNVVARSAPPGGVQGTGWVELTALHAGTTRVGVSGGCALPDPVPSEPPGDQLVCTAIAAVYLVNVTVR